MNALIGSLFGVVLLVAASGCTRAHESQTPTAASTAAVPVATNRPSPTATARTVSSYPEQYHTKFHERLHERSYHHFRLRMHVQVDRSPRWSERLHFRGTEGGAKRQAIGRRTSLDCRRSRC